MDLLKEYKELHQSIYNCTSCRKIGKEVHRIQPEWDDNRKPTRIRKWGLIVGQAPGLTEKKKSESTQVKSEIREKIPFSGKAGEQFKNWFINENIDYKPILETSLMTSLTKCYPGRIKKSDRKPGKKEIKLCESFLRKQIELVSPKIIIPIGKQSIDWFFPEEKNLPLSERIGYFSKWKDYDIICLPHPSPISALIKKIEVKVKISDSIKIINNHWKKWNLP